jgi:hypothetical protein
MLASPTSSHTQRSTPSLRSKSLYFLVGPAVSFCLITRRVSTYLSLGRAATAQALFFWHGTHACMAGDRRRRPRDLRQWGHLSRQSGCLCHPTNLGRQAATPALDVASVLQTVYTSNQLSTASCVPFSLQNLRQQHRVSFSTVVIFNH